MIQPIISKLRYLGRCDHNQRPLFIQLFPFEGSLSILLTRGGSDSVVRWKPMELGLFVKEKLVQLGLHWIWKSLTLFQWRVVEASMK
jgi:hypothetical protein